MWHPLATCHILSAIGHVKVKATRRYCHYTRGRLHRLNAIRAGAGGAGAWQWKARMAVRSTAVGLLGLSSFDCRVSGAPSTKDALHFNEDIRRCDSVSVATPASSLVSTDCLPPAFLSSYSPYPMPSLPPTAVSHYVSHSVSQSVLGRVLLARAFHFALGHGQRQERERERVEKRG